MDFLQVNLLCCLMWFYICQMGHYTACTCQPGERKKYNKICEPCPDVQYQPEPGRDFCQNCGSCGEGSELISKCTRTANVKCRCREGFVPLEKHQKSCQCDKGSELDKTGNKCLRCKEGYFNTDAGQKCRTWTDCGTRGVRNPGSPVSDVVCNNGPGNSRTSDTLGPASATVHGEKHVTVPLTVPRSLPFTVTTAPPRPSPSITPPTSTSTSMRTTRRPVESSGFPGYFIAMPPLLLLILLSPIISKKLLIPFIQKYKRKPDTPCGRPIEESGDSSHSSLVKSGQGQP